MSSDDWPDWLPAEWFMEISNVNNKIVKCYIDPEGHKCYSKPQVFEYLKKTNNNNGTTSTNAHDADASGVDLSMEPDVDHTNEGPGTGGQPTKLTTRSNRKRSQESEGSVAGDGSPSEPKTRLKKIEDSSWLPDGWTVEVKTRKGGSSSGMKYKIYTDPISGQKFFSKPQVLSHLAKTNGNAAAAGQTAGSPVPIIATPISAWKSSTEPDTEVKGNSGSTPEKKKESPRSASDYEVISRTPVEDLPSGWIKELRMKKRGTVKRSDPYYLDPLSEYVFFSKKDALRYLETGDVTSCAIKPLKRDMNEDSRNANLTTPEGEMASQPPSKGTETSEPLTNGTATDLKTDESNLESPKPVRSITGGDFSTPKKEVADWLPDGWAVEVHYKSSGQKYKIYKESASGKKLFSKPQVLSYLANGSSSNSRKRKENKPVAAYDSLQTSESDDVGRPKRVVKKKGATKKSDYKEVIETSPADGLPAGWIKEIRTKIYGTHQRRDPYYTDPVSGYIFRSKVDAMRYLETGDISLCAIRPKMKDKDGNEVPVYTNSVQKPATTPTNNQLDEGKVGEDMNNQHNDAKGRASRSSRKRNLETGPSSVGPTEDNGPVSEKQVSGINLEKLADDDQLCYDIPEDENWPDIDFAVKTLTNEILFNGQQTSAAPFQDGSVRAETSANETPTKVN
ncbi:uncharacterized protein [Rutidosis leptorrhynchoides]|uniref:uncharacterized protein n=1 Tax=Rutidosis leptorrhynchoides TaxID=125765 RepID=UPI003A98E43D